MKGDYSMVSKENFVKIMNSVAATYNAHCLTLETLGLLEDDNCVFMRLVDSVVETLSEGLCLPDHPDVWVEDCGRRKPEFDMPLLFWWCWDVNFGDGFYEDGSVPIIVIEGHNYYLCDADALWECLNHLNQFCWHHQLGIYSVDEEPRNS